MYTFRCIGMACVVALAAVALASAQQARPIDPAPAVARGELVKVDTEAKTISIKTDQGAEMKFSYTDATKVVGADNTVAGLATTSGTKVIVRYRSQGQMLMATEVEVQKASA